MNLLVERIALGDDLIDDAEGSGILGRQEIVAVEGLFDRGVVLTSVAVAGTGRDAYWGKVGEVCSDAEKYGAP